MFKHTIKISILLLALLATGESADIKDLLGNIGKSLQKNGNIPAVKLPQNNFVYTEPILADSLQLQNITPLQAVNLNLNNDINAINTKNVLSNLNNAKKSLDNLAPQLKAIGNDLSKILGNVAANSNSKATFKKTTNLPTNPIQQTSYFVESYDPVINYPINYAPNTIQVLPVQPFQPQIINEPVYQPQPKKSTNPSVYSQSISNSAKTSIYDNQAPSVGFDETIYNSQPSF